jgi:Protein of unknown function (DUF4054)
MTTPAPPITFDYQDWVSMFPELKGVPEAAAMNNYWVRAQGICANSLSNPLAGLPAGTLKLGLYLLTAHIAALNSPIGGQPSSTLVGRISNATQGSVTVAAEWDGSGTPGESWFTQTKYGAEYWTLSARTRTAYYIARPTRVPYSFVNGGRFGGFWA